MVGSVMLRRTDILFQQNTIYTDKKLAGIRKSKQMMNKHMCGCTESVQLPSHDQNDLCGAHIVDRTSHI